MTIPAKSITSAFDLFPDLFQQGRPSPPTARSDRPGDSGERTNFRRDTPHLKRVKKTTVAAPLPPDISWLPSGVVPGEGYEGARIRHGMILISDKIRRDKVAKHLTAFGYFLHFPHDSTEAIAQIQGVMPAVVIADADDAFPGFHRYLSRLAMPTRRLIHYTLIGPEYRTLYNLEALAHSVNLVVGYGELDHLDRILRVSFQDYQRLFLPFMEMMRQEFPLLT